MAEKIEVLTFCHDCEQVFNGQHLNCPACESDAVLMCAPGPTIRDWIKTEEKMDKAKTAQCGCCDPIFS